MGLSDTGMIALIFDYVNIFGMSPNIYAYILFISRPIRWMLIPYSIILV